MFPGLFVFFLTLFLIWWVYCGYLIMIYLFKLFSGGNPEKDDTRPREYPEVSLLISCFNESDYVERKIRNTIDIDYPREKIEVFFLDGCSTDGTPALLKQKIDEMGLKNFHVIETGKKGKINQINYFLPQVKSEIVINSDMDAELEKDTLIEIIKEFERDKNIYVVGAHVIPRDSLPSERLYWDTQNQFRVWESTVYSSSMVIAPCYAFKNELLSGFPEDCVADDIFIACHAITKGKKTIYSKNATVYELRTPRTLEKLMSHKFRKANAYIIELLRFLYLIPRMPNRWKMIYLTKVIQVLFMPWLIVFYFLATLSFVFTGKGLLEVASFGIVFLTVSFLISHIIVSKNLKRSYNTNVSHFSSLVIFLITNFILLVAAITYPFYQQFSDYKKIE